MRKLPLEQPPEDEKKLREWLSRMMLLINGTIDQVHDHDVIYELPTTSFDGMIRLFGQSILPDIPAAGLYLYQSEKWNRLISGDWDAGYVDGKIYYPGDLVGVGSWTFRALVQTTENPTPIISGDTRWLSSLGVFPLPDAPSWDSTSPYATSVWTGQNYAAVPTGYTTRLRIWVPQSDATIRREINDYDVLGIGSYVGTKTGWVYLTIPKYINPAIIFRHKLDANAIVRSASLRAKVPTVT